MRIWLLLLICLGTLHLTGAEFRSVHPSLRSAVTTMLRLPEARQLLDRISKEGPVAVEVGKWGAKQSGAMWHPAQRKIVVNMSKKHSEGQKIAAIFFEMHNASTCRRFLELDTKACQGKISKRNYVESVEKIEHQNAVIASSLLEKAIARGIYPQDARWPILRDFRDHFQLQQQMGHSSQIACSYDTLAMNLSR